MNFEKATINDLNELISLRIAYLCEDYNGLSDDAVATCETQLTAYYKPI